MTQHYHSGRILAIIAGTASTIGACGLLLAEPITSGHWSLDHALTPLIVGLTVAAGHLSVSALRSRKLLAALGFAVAFGVGTAVTVLNGVGRQAESAETKAAETTKSNRAVLDKQTELTRARQRLEQANTMSEREMTGQRCGPRCNDWKIRASEVASHIALLEVQLARLGAVKPVNVKATKVGELVAAFGGNARRAEVAVGLAEPLLVPFLLEWLAIVALGYGAHRQPAQPPPAAAAQPATSRGPSATGGNRAPTTAATEATGRPSLSNRKPPVVVNPVASKVAAEADVVRLVARGESMPSQDALAQRWRVNKGTASRWLADFEHRGLIRREWDGRHKRVASAASARTVRRGLVDECLRDGARP